MDALKDLPDLNSNTCWICESTPAPHPGFSALTGMEVRLCDACFASVEDAPSPRPPSFKRDCAVCGEPVDVRSRSAHTLNNEGKSVHRNCLPRRSALIGPPGGHRNQREYEDYLDALEFDATTHKRG